MEREDNAVNGQVEWMEIENDPQLIYISHKSNFN